MTEASLRHAMQRRVLTLTTRRRAIRQGHAPQSLAWVRASSVHDHFGTYHFGIGLSTNVKYGPVRSSMDHSIAAFVASDLVSSRFDYANSVLLCCPQKHIGLARLQRAQNALARVVTQQSSRSYSLTLTYRSSQTAPMANQVQTCLFNLQSITYRSSAIPRRPFPALQAHEVHAFTCHSLTFYRAIHFSAKRGIAIACRLSVCLSVRDVGGSGPHRLEILETNCTNN